MVRYLAWSLIAAVVLIQFADSKPAYQVLENKPGYIPVYIRFGDQPLADINPILAEAFGEHEVKARNAKTDSNLLEMSPLLHLNMDSLLSFSPKAHEIKPKKIPLISEEIKPIAHSEESLTKEKEQEI